MEVGDFTVIIMKLGNGKKLYLKCGSGKSMKWTADRSESCYFNTETQAEKFASKYFKNFKNYQFETFTEYI